MEELGKLEEKKQLQVLDFARILAEGKPIGTPGNSLIQIAVGIDPDDLRRMSDAISEDCERVDSVQ